MVLKERQVCPHSTRCPYNINSTCQGANPRREEATFTCEWVTNGIIDEGRGVRLAGDKTGKMKVIME